MEYLTIGQQIRSEIYRAFELLGADSDLLAVVGSWGDTLKDEEILVRMKRFSPSSKNGMRSKRGAEKLPEPRSHARRLRS